MFLRKPFHSTSFSIISGFVAVPCLLGLMFMVVGDRLIRNYLSSEIEIRLNMDVTAARELYDRASDDILLVLDSFVYFTDPDEIMRPEAFSNNPRLREQARTVHMDFAALIDLSGEIVATWEGGSAPVVGLNPLAARQALATGQRTQGTELLPPGFITPDQPLSERLVNPHSEASPDATMSAMALVAAVPVVRDGRLAGVLYGGRLLNQDTLLVDLIYRTLFVGGTSDGLALEKGSATVFAGDVRVTTTVQSREGQRAVGTRASAEVAQSVLVKGQRWEKRALVLDKWHFTVYEPLRDLTGQIIGMLYVGVSEEKYTGLTARTRNTFIALAAAGICVALLIGSWLSWRIVKPVRQLLQVSRQVTSGRLMPDMGPISTTDLGQLQETFMEMLAALRERERRQQEEHEYKLVQSDKHAVVGKLAAGVAHEVNNPMTGILSYTHLLMKRTDLPPEVLEDLSFIAKQTERVRKIVRGLLEFSRQRRPEMALYDPQDLIDECLRLLAQQALLKNITLTSIYIDPPLPPVYLDHNQMQSVIVNLLINAMDASPLGTIVRLTSRISVVECEQKKPRRSLLISVKDQGSGIPEELLETIFDPFFTTKPIGKGTGLGLSVSAGIVQRHGGAVTVRSLVGEGTEFVVQIPVDLSGAD